MMMLALERHALLELLLEANALEVRATGAEAALARVLSLHTKRMSGDRYRCTACVAGYDPANGELVYAAWPCATIEALGEAPDAG